MLPSSCDRGEVLLLAAVARREVGATLSSVGGHSERRRNSAPLAVANGAENFH